MREWQFDSARSHNDNIKNFKHYMVNEQKLHEIAKPRNKKEHRKFMLRHYFRWFVTKYQNFLLYLYRLKSK